ncbi:hypothetical protein I4U23_004592 [Adineta vaga]|nr:hypothetical protein I4U23_004592 [Adineta vaga]
MNTFYADILWTENSCLVILYLQTMVVCQFIYALCIVSLNRLCAIAYQRKVLFRKKKWAIMCIGIQWIFAAIISLPQFGSSLQHCFISGLELSYQIYVLFIVGVLPGIFLAITNSILFSLVRRSTRRIHTGNQALDAQPAVALSQRDAQLLKHMLIITLAEQVDQTTIYVQPIHFILSMITNILNICILRDRTLRSSPCTHYFLSFSCASILYTCILCPTQILRRYNILWMNTNIGCKLSPYLLFVLPLQASIMLILASFDRFCSSSSESIKLRSLSNVRIAQWSIIFSSILCALYMLPMMFIYDFNSNLHLCIQYSNTPTTIYAFSQIGIYYILAPIIMMIFGVLTISNIRRQLTRIQPRTCVRPNRRTESQLARMLIIQIAVHMIISLPFGIMYLINTFIPSSRTPFIIGIRLIFVAWQQCDYFVPFFLYILSGGIYREKLVRMFKSNYHVDNSITGLAKTQACNIQNTYSNRK